MEGSFSDEQVHAWLEELRQNAWVSLHYDNPVLGAIGAAEITGGGYGRVRCEFSEPTNRTIWSLSNVTFSGLLQNSLTHFAIWSAQTSGFMRASAQLPEKKVVLNGWGYELAAGELALSLE